MIDLWKYQDVNTIKITDIDDNEYTGNVIDVTDSEEYMNDDIKEDGITIASAGKHIEFMQSEIKSIEIIKND